MEIKITNLYKSFSQGTATLDLLKGINFAFQSNYCYAIMGASGSGKSTLLQLIAGLDTPDQGHVLYDGTPINQLSLQERTTFLAAKLGLVFQHSYLIHELSVLENVMLKGLISGQRVTDCKEKAFELLATMGLASKADSQPASLSGGQQQRVAILRALYNKPAFLIADEPTGSLDEATSAGVIDFLLACQAQWGMGLIVSSHDMHVAMRMQIMLQLNDGLLHLPVSSSLAKEQVLDYA